MTIIKVKAKKSWAGPGMEGFDAEAKVMNDEGKAVYVHCTMYEYECYSVAEKSTMNLIADTAIDEDDEYFDNLLDTCFIEVYISLGDAIKSDYIDIFMYLRKVLDGMIDISYGHKKSTYKDIVGEVKEKYISEFKSLNDFDFGFSYSFDYQSQVMEKEEVRVLTAGVTQDGKYFRLTGDYNEVIEEFDDLSQTVKSKWAILYEKAMQEAIRLFEDKFYDCAEAHGLTEEETARIEALLSD